MHPNAIQKIENKIKGSLLNCQVKDNWPQYESFVEHVNSLGKEILKHKKEWLDIHDVFSIFYDLVYESISRKIEGDQKLEGQLWDVLGEEDGKQLITTLKDFFLSIPREYDVFIPLPKISQNIDSSIELSENISIDIFTEASKVPGGARGGLLGFIDTKLEVNKVYLRQRLSGYCSKRLENACNKKAIKNFKVLLQQGTFKKLFKTNSDERAELGLFGAFSNHQIPRVHVISLDKAREPVKLAQIELPLEFCKWLNTIDLNWETEPFATAVKDGKTSQAIHSILKKPVELIECEFEESVRVVSAIQWCFNSYILENETLAFLQVCIGLEAILGDEGYNGQLTETLADRCSYLISNDIKGRKSIKKTFKELYDVRSKLVHGNATELDSTQQWYLSWGRTILEYAIIKEIKHLNLGKT